ncbi:hypothetical protein RKD46_002479 [Streptomyces pseudovenezuelae]|uniref:hypothetical protein n=1 Tax=unclassified Streptomyces TaxID=2593676 RepID=UPI002474207B|nr:MULTISPECIES: hypothetical protein [unclassified Streptomyces]MDH6516047.1 hypothetical protein [Streptomyces sp. SAI-090]MDH6548261.1 hypothetical protein [Streptomyces sp. SAI-041]MDH6619867.1 hypothetical protein [Streptomyces sp. SAI-135]
METTTNTREATSTTQRRRRYRGTTRHPAVFATLSALLLSAASIAGRIRARGRGRRRPGDAACLARKAART